MNIYCITVEHLDDSWLVIADDKKVALEKLTKQVPMILESLDESNPNPTKENPQRLGVDVSLVPFEEGVVQMRDVF